MPPAEPHPTRLEGSLLYPGRTMEEVASPVIVTLEVVEQLFAPWVAPEIARVVFAIGPDAVTVQEPPSVQVTPLTVVLGFVKIILFLNCRARTALGREVRIPERPGLDKLLIVLEDFLSVLL